MVDRLHYALRISSICLVYAGFMALASVRNYGVSILFFPTVFVVAMPFGEFLDLRYPAFRISRKLSALAYILFIPLSLQLYGLMDAVLLLVAYIQLYLMLGVKTVRIYYEIYLMSFFMLLAAVVQAPEPLIAVAFILFSVSAVWAFSLVKMYNDRETCPKSPLIELTNTSKSKLFPRKGGLFDSGLVISLIALSVLSIAITIISFYVTPRMEAGWLGRQDFRPAFTGISETVRIRGTSSVYEDPSVVMHVRFPDEGGGELAEKSGMYWRITTLPRFSRDEWSRHGLQETYEPKIEKTLYRRGRYYSSEGMNEVARRPQENVSNVVQNVYMDSVPEQGVPVLHLPLKLALAENTSRALVSWDEGQDFTISLQTGGVRRLEYTAISEIIIHDPELLRQCAGDYSFMETRDFSMLTYQELLPETLAKVKEVTNEKTGIYEKVIALRNWLSSTEFVYSLDLPQLPARNGIDAFIMNEKRGHCELYASALALMARSLGVPARVVSGYRGGEYSAADDAYLVRANMSHLWVEVLFDGVGWVIFDPSPQEDVISSQIGRMRMAWSLYLLRAKMFWYQEVVGFRSGFRLDNISWPWNQSEIEDHSGKAQEQDQNQQEKKSEMPGDWEYTVVGIILAACIYLIAKKRKKRGSAIVLTRDQSKARSLYMNFIRECRRAGVITENHSAQEILAQLQKISSADYGTAEKIVEHYHAVRFGGGMYEPTARLLAKDLFRHR